MNNYTREDILRMVEEEDVGFIRLQFTDMYGTLKNVAITSSQLEKALDNECMFDGSAIEGFARMEDSDMYLRPDLNTFEIFPWRPQQGKVARLLCDVQKADGSMFESDPRYVLKESDCRSKKRWGIHLTWDQSVSSSYSIRTKTDFRLHFLMRRQAILIWDR